MAQGPPTRPDLLERFDRLDITANNFERRYAFPANFIGKLKQGFFHSEKSADTIRKFEEAIVKEEQGVVPGSESVQEFHAKQGRPTKAETRTVEQERDFEELYDAVEHADDIEAVDQCNKKVQLCLLRGVITDTSARVLKELLGERRQSLEDREERAREAQGQQEVLYRVVYVRNWTGGPLPSEKNR